MKRTLTLTAIILLSLTVQAQYIEKAWSAGPATCLQKKG